MSDSTAVPDKDRSLGKPSTKFIIRTSGSIEATLRNVGPREAIDIANMLRAHNEPINAHAERLDRYAFGGTAYPTAPPMDNVAAQIEPAMTNGDIAAVNAEADDRVGVAGDIPAEEAAFARQTMARAENQIRAERRAHRAEIAEAALAAGV